MHADSQPQDRAYPFVTKARDKAICSTPMNPCGAPAVVHAHLGEGLDLLRCEKHWQPLKAVLAQRGYDTTVRPRL